MEEDKWPFAFFGHPQITESPFQVIAHRLTIIMEDMYGKFMQCRAAACISFLQLCSPNPSNDLERWPHA
jgi:hypothetical protein